MKTFGQAVVGAIQGTLAFLGCAFFVGAAGGYTADLMSTADMLLWMGLAFALMALSYLISQIRTRLARKSHKDVREERAA